MHLFPLYTTNVVELLGHRVANVTLEEVLGQISEAVVIIHTPASIFFFLAVFCC